MSRQRLPLTGIDEASLKSRLLAACADQEYGLFLDSNQHADRYSRFKWLAGFGAAHLISGNRNSLNQLQYFRQKHQDWLLGHLSFDLKNELEELHSHNPDKLTFPHLQFFVPDHLVYSDNQGIWLESLKAGSVDQFLASLPPLSAGHTPTAEVRLTSQTSRQEYLATVESLMKELQYGNIYEINYCIEFASENCTLNPLATYQKLNNISSAPFAGFYRSADCYLLCASPERYLQKHGNRLVSQPMKGTISRSEDLQQDDCLRRKLRESEKEQSENVMITDLVRNDLSRTASAGSVQVEELFGVYSYKTVHQMLSTVSSRIREGISCEEVLRTSFPMGSMTGAPKISALKLIEAHEKFSRGLYSGSIGYISPTGDFDFNVVIRSLFYQARTGYLSARVGSAITIHCDPEAEYEECYLKAVNLFRSLSPERVSVS